MKQIILAEFESVFLPFKDDKDKLTNLEEMCRVLIALDMLGAHIIVYTAGDKNDVLQFFSYFAPSILSQSDVLKIDSEPDSKPFIILSAINYHNQVSPVDEHITDCFEEQVIVLDGDPDFVNQLTAAHAHIRVKAYLVDNDNFTHRRMLESLFNSIYLNATQSAVAARARRNREEAILDNDQKLLQSGYLRSMAEFKGEINGSIAAIMREIFYYLLLRRRLTAVDSQSSISALQNISEFLLKCDTHERDRLLKDTEQQLDEQQIPSSQDLINYLALQYRYRHLAAHTVSPLPSVDDFLRLSVDARNALFEKAEKVIAKYDLPTQQQVFHYLKLVYCCAEQNIEHESPPLDRFLVLETSRRIEIVAGLEQKLQRLADFHMPPLSKHMLSELLAVALNEPLTNYLLQYIPLETLKDLYIACLSEIKNTSLALYKEWLLDHPVTQLKIGDDKYKVLVIRSHRKAKINEKALSEALAVYENQLKQFLECEKQYLQKTPLSLLQLMSKYTVQSELAMREITDIENSMTECRLALDKKREEISKEFEEAVRPKEQENLRGTMIGRRQAIDSEDTQNGKVLNACREGNLDALKVAIAEMGAAFDVHHAYTANNNRTLLDIACLHAYVDMARYLLEGLERCADVNYQVSGAPPLVYALRGLHHYPSRIEIIRLLLDKGAELNFKTTDNSGNTPLHIAAQQGNVRGVELLAQWIVVQKPQEGFNVNATNREDRTALLEAIYADRRCKLLPVIEMLLSYGICLRAEDMVYLRSHPNFNQKILPAIANYINQQANVFDQSQSAISLSSAASVNIQHRAPPTNVLMSPTSPRVRRGSFLAVVMPIRSSGADAQLAASSVSTITASESISPRQRSGSISFGSTAPMAAVSPRKNSFAEQYLESPLSTSPRMSPTSAAAATSPSDPIRRTRSNSVKGFFTNVFSSRENSPARSSDSPASGRNYQTLFEAVRAKDHAAVKRMISDLAGKHKLSMAYVRDDASGHTALQEAVLLGERECIKCFYDAGICLSKLDSQMLLPQLTINSRNLLVEMLREMAQGYALDQLSNNQSPRMDSVTSPRRMHPTP